MIDLDKVEGEVIEAKLNEKKDGIILKVKSDKGCLHCESTIRDDWLRIPVGMNAEVELQKVCDLFNGYQPMENGEKVPIKGFKRKKVSIIRQGE